MFYNRAAGFTVAEIAELTGARHAPEFPASLRINDVAAIERAGPHDVTFYNSARDEVRLRLTQAGACFVPADLAAAVPSGAAALVVDDPYRAFVRVATALYPQATRPSSLFAVQGRAPSALVHPEARVEAGVTIDPAAVIAPGAEIGAGTVVGPMVVIGPGVRIGRDCVIEAGASLTNALVGDRVALGPGCRIGFAGRGSGAPLGRVILQDKVGVGANCVIERGRDRDTIIGEGTMIDVLVRIPADIVVGRYCRIMAFDRASTAGAIDDTSVDGVQLSASQLERADGSYLQRTV